ncbi:hypothetical protein FNF31_06603 [Cafeteria roenbergensis]|uniref:Glycosyl transferase family 1 domain-containing protein n=1 Tax=Cafeteria roenbergensis TaxID=33653 RepID=A0A5A8D487_CAFRO|nr:hypothetical protein FNF31_06603 [Cafeteria roenbergensis]KAA0160018.1 hypothetical protein FNF28_05598 [Cafeteria roenbergensis]
MVQFWHVPKSRSREGAVPATRQVPLVAAHSLAAPRADDLPSVVFFFPNGILQHTTADYMSSWGEQANASAVAYSSEWQLHRYLTRTLGLCSGRPAARRDTIALVIPPRLHGNSLAAIDECKHDRNVWVWNTEQLTNPGYLALTSVLMQQGWRVVDMLAQNRCLVWFSLCARGALGRELCGAASGGRGEGSCPGGLSIRGGGGTMLLEWAQGCESGDDDPRMGLVCLASRGGGRSGDALPEVAGGGSVALRVVPYQLTSEVDRLRELLSRVRPEEREYDVAFVGVLGIARSRTLELLRLRGFTVVVANAPAQERDELIASARVLVNIHYAVPNFVFESLRCDRWIAAGHVVVSEPSWGDDTNDLRGAYVTSPEPTPHSLAATVVRVLSDLEGTRARLSAALSERLESVRASRAAALASWLADN